MKRTPFYLGLGVGLLLMLVVGLNLSFGQASNNVHETLPSNNSTFLSDLQTFLKKENADRYTDHFTSMVVSGCTHGTGAGLTKTPSSCTGYPAGSYSTETGSITYNDNTTSQWVVMDNTTTGNKLTFTRVSGTHYLLDTTSGAAQPTLCSGCMWLMQVTAAAGAVTAVTDLRSMVPQAATYTLASLPTPGSRGRLAYVRDQSTLYFDNGASWTAFLANPMSASGDIITGGASGTTVRLGIGSNFNVLQASNGLVIYAPVGLSASGAVSGVLQPGNGGTGQSTAPSNNILIGNGTGYALTAIPNCTTNLTFASSTNTFTCLAVATNNLPRSYLAGYKMNNTAASTSTVIDIASGVARDTVNAFDMNRGSTASKVLQGGGSWASGPGNNGLFTGARASGTIYHVCAIRDDVDGTVDFGFDTSATCANRPVGKSNWRRIGAIMTDASSNIRQFIQSGGWMQYVTPKMDVDTTSQSMVTIARPLSVPTGVKVLANMTVLMGEGATGADKGIYLYDPDLVTVPSLPNNASAPLMQQLNTAAGAGNFNAGQIQVWTNAASGAVMSIAGQTVTLRIVTLGYFDLRGRDD